MSTELQDLIFAADDHYLSDADLNRFQNELQSLNERLNLYEYIRDHEVTLLQPAVDYLVEELSNKDTKVLERAVTHWISILRYTAMAMLQSDAKFLEEHILNWLPDVVDAYDLRDVEIALYRFLQAQLKSSLPPQQLDLIQPYLEQAYKLLRLKKGTVQAKAA
jgi:Phycobilisome protein